MVPGSSWCIKVREKSPESLLVKWHMLLTSLELSPSPAWPWRSPQPSMTLEVPAAQCDLGGPKQPWHQALWSPVGCDSSTVSLDNPNTCKEKLTGILWWRQAIPILAAHPWSIIANHWEGIQAIASSQDWIHAQTGCKLLPPPLLQLRWRSPHHPPPHVGNLASIWPFPCLTPMFSGPFPALPAACSWLFTLFKCCRKMLLFLNIK